MSEIPQTVVTLAEEDVAAAAAVLRSGRLTQGAEVSAFEQEFAVLVDGRACVAVNSGTSALHLALLAHGVGPGDEVVVPSFTFAATANAVALTGATPVFGDIDPATFCLDPDHVASLLTPRTTAIVPVHLFGQVASAVRLRALAQRHGLLLLEDACQAHAASSDGVPAGAWGQAAAFSFYATKNLSTGEGGMVVCADPAIARRVRLLRNQGMEERYRNEIVGLNNRMTDVAAAIGRRQLARLPGATARRRAIAALYDERLIGVVTPRVEPGNVHVYHQYTVRARDRDGLREHLAEHGVGCAIFYPVPVHRLPPFRRKHEELPETERAAGEVLSLPMWPELTDAHVERVAGAVSRWAEGGA